MAGEGENEEQTNSSKFEKNEEWSPNQISHLYQYKQFWYPGLFIDGVIKAQKLRFSPSDILLCSSPKTGTIWLKALAFTIVSRTQFDPFSEDHPILTSFPHSLIPFIETPKYQHPELPLLATHIPYTALPKSVLEEDGCKIVYMCRNPKDALVSLWQFIPKLEPEDQRSNIPLDKAFDLFCRGITPFGPYWDHALEYWRASLDHPTRVLFLKYEDMMEDAMSHVARLADFMGYPFSEEEERRGVPAKIVDMCSFESLSNLEVNKGNRYVRGVAMSNTMMFRKAKVGDWRNYLTHQMAAKLDQISIEKLGGFGLTL